ncbi:hypothetical protein [Actinoplanes subtropicus]|uniref:hypothetical protein n=1 Tax=Actinoplanes subtropicus TaxID=543632 RepID=UPI0004C3DAC7|nr:hypothetical protein [Actinoplanes subtropicus]
MNGTGNTVIGNSIGTDAAGTGSLRNVGGAGVSLTGGPGTVSGNLISGNDTVVGVDVGATANGSTISTPSSPFHLEFFSGTSCAAASTTLLGTDRIVTGPPASPTRNGTTPLTAPVAAGSFLVATATEVSPTGELDSTSEFSPCFQV